MGAARSVEAPSLVIERDPAAESGVRGGVLRLLEESIEGGAVVERAAADDRRDLLGVADVRERIGVEHDEIGELALRDGTELGLDAHETGRSRGGGAERFGG